MKPDMINIIISGITYGQIKDPFTLIMYFLPTKLTMIRLQIDDVIENEWEVDASKWI